MTLYYLITKTEPFKELTPYIVVSEILKGNRPKFINSVPDCWLDLIKKCWQQNPSQRPNFTEICNTLESPLFNNDSIDKKLFSEYIQKIKRPNILSKSDDKKFSRNADSSGIECSVCLKKFNEKEIIFVEDAIFMCHDDFDRFERLKELPQKFVNDYCDKIIDETFSPFVSSTSIEFCGKDDIFIDSETLNDSLVLNEDFKYFCPTVTFHFERSPSEIDFKKIIEILPDCMSITRIRKGSTFIVIAFVASEEFEMDEEACREMIEEVKAKLNPPLKEPIVGNFEKQTFEVPDDDEVRKYFQKKSVNIFQSPGILNLIDGELHWEAEEAED
ncbi:hypothetical protein M9Y10_004217 [Tritrichomonas musculus]|uniref:Serine-threonine/tyrosine-protein kinase catalytic domain-containing protein n=1 Tax=Tritrichomonas musculus TaxID=1915356 RepID=A0ABR2JSS4_9EUKA